MANRTFIIPKSKGKSLKTIGAIDVAARYFVYKLYEATGRQPMQWAAAWTARVSGDHFPGGEARLGHSPGREGQASGP